MIFGQKKDDDAADSAIKMKKIEGTNFSKNGVVEIDNDNQELEELMQELQHKFKKVSAIITLDLDREEQKIFNRRLKDEDLTEYKNLSKMDAGPGTRSQDSSLLYQNDKVAQKLRENLTAEAREAVTLPFDICNVLKAEIDQKKKLRRLLEQNQLNSRKRVDNRKLLMIRKEFNAVKGPLRSFAILDLILGGLKFLQRFSPEQRRAIYEHARIRSEPAQTTIFKQDEYGHEMYIIIKGRVAV